VCIVLGSRRFETHRSHGAVQIRQLHEEIRVLHEQLNEAEMYKAKALEYRKRELSLAAELDEAVAALDDRRDRRESNAEKQQLAAMIDEMRQRAHGAEELVQSLQQQLSHARRAAAEAEAARDSLLSEMQHMRRAHDQRARVSDTASRAATGSDQSSALIATLLATVSFVDRTVTAALHGNVSAEEARILAETLSTMKRMIQSVGHDGSGLAISSSSASAAESWRQEFNFCVPILKVG
jgi:chromosome segregation ATPase